MATYPPDIEQYIEQKIQNGEFRSRDDFAAAAARLYREMDERHRTLKSDVAAALAEADRGESQELDIDAIKRELEAELDEQGEPR